MDTRQIQTLLKAAGYYTGDVDGALGPKSQAAVAKLLSNHFPEGYAVWKWTQGRRAIAAAQLILKFARYYEGAVDGYAGHLTNDAYAAWAGELPKVSREPAPSYKPVKSPFPRQADCAVFYGMPTSPKLVNQLKMYDLPLPMRIDYDLSTMTKRVQLHEKCGPSAMAAMQEIVKHYGEARWRQLGLDRNAGTYNPRRMRGGSAWSMHAYGCAWDFYAEPNGLNTHCPQALFCREEYKAFFDIWESHGWTSLGRAIGRDWMHVQAASL